MVSVIIPAYNREKTVLNSVLSVLNQTYRDLELILVDDGSTDNTKDVLKAIDDCRFHYYYQNNAGACRARNYGIELAKGDYIAFHDSDDIWHKDKLEKQMIAIEKTNADILFCKLNQYSNGVVEKVIPQNIDQGFLDPVKNLFGIGTQTIIAKADVFKSLRFDEQLPRFQEFELLLTAAEHKYSIYCLDEGLVDYYIGDDSISSNPEKLYIACQKIIDKHPDMRSSYPSMVKTMGYKLKKEAENLAITENENYFSYMNLAFKLTNDYKILLKIFIKKIKGVF